MGDPTNLSGTDELGICLGPPEPRTDSKKDTLSPEKLYRLRVQNLRVDEYLILDKEDFDKVCHCRWYKYKDSYVTLQGITIETFLNLKVGKRIENTYPYDFRKQCFNKLMTIELPKGVLRY